MSCRDHIKPVSGGERNKISASRRKKRKGGGGGGIGRISSANQK